mmetsp:Transcript_45563/g.134897  ORF Transcript_45563/g.134897 Transcript_45563/m.134897 type:complete len:219 (+) Transcript_45563:1278-1934(+)
MSTPAPCFCSSRMTVAFPCGVMRAKIRIVSTVCQRSGIAATAAVKPSPVAMRVKDLSSSAMGVASGLFSPRISPVATTHSAIASSPFAGSAARLRTRPGRSPSVIPHVRATWRAVSGASPVSIATLWPDSRRAPITSAESERERHSKAMKPQKVRSHSTISRVSSPWSSLAAGRRRQASARTRRPRSARSVCALSYHAGAAPLARRRPTASGEPLTRA